MGSDFTDLHKQGSDLGKLLENGEADKARKGYDALILRIQDETRDKPVDRERRIDEVHAGMAQADPTDVKSPGNGTDKGYYIYWNTENLVTESIDKISAFCRGHNNCQSLDWDQQKRAASSYVMPQEVANAPLWSQRDTSELNSLLTDTNNWLYKMLPDGLERYTFKDDFNRRRSKSGLEAVMDDSLSVVIREKEQ
jgi:hypothetical protein